MKTVSPCMHTVTLCVAPMYPPRIHIVKDLYEGVDRVCEHRRYFLPDPQNPRLGILGDCVIIDEVMEAYYVSYSNNATEYEIDCIYGAGRYIEIAEIDAETLPSGLGTYTPEAALICIHPDPGDTYGVRASVVPLANYSLVKLLRKRKK